jgi:hypothetical protein
VRATNGSTKERGGGLRLARPAPPAGFLPEEPPRLYLRWSVGWVRSEKPRSRLVWGLRGAGCGPSKGKAKADDALDNSFLLGSCSPSCLLKFLPRRDSRHVV